MNPFRNRVKAALWPKFDNYPIEFQKSCMAIVDTVLNEVIELANDRLHSYRDTNLDHGALEVFRNDLIRIVKDGQ